MKNYTLNLMRLSLALVIVMSSNLTFAQENIVVASIAKPVADEKIVTEGDALEAKKEKEEAEEGKFSVSGYIDSYYFTNFNTSAYSLTIGTMEIRADKQGQPCEGFASGQTADARYDSKTLMLERDKRSCKLRVRRMEFTDPPGSAPPAAR